MNHRARELAPPLRTFAITADNQGLIPTVHRWFTTICYSSARGLVSIGTRNTSGTYIDTSKTSIHIILKFKKKNIKLKCNRKLPLYFLELSEGYCYRTRRIL